MLRRVELRGFKSFAGTTVLDLGPGLNVVVGPNGSGKSNLAEAIVWAMGEQRASRLRAGAMGDVVFSGGAGRPAAGVAEVRLTLDDGLGEPGAAAETEVWRRVTRAGDAAYRLNGAACRLLDVHEALAARGLGPDALAVIRQGQVEAVCTARPADLRAILEEAAGVALSRRRRRRAEARLAKVGERLDRARDLAAELASRRATLERQAGAAARAADLEARIAEARDLADRAAAHAADRALRAATDAFSRASADGAVAADAAGRARRGAERAQEDLGRAQASASAAEGAATALAAAAERVADRHGLAGERIREATARAERLDREARRAHEERTALERAIAEASASLAAAEAGVAAADHGMDAARAVLGERTTAGREARAAGDEAEARGREAAGRLRRAETRVDELRRGVGAAEAALARVAAGDVADLDRVRRRAEVSAERRVRWDRRQADAAALVEDAEAAFRAASDRRRQADEEAARLRPDDRAGRAGLGAAVRARAGAESAVGAALGDLADALLAGDLASGLAALRDGAGTVVIPAPAAPAGTAPALGTPVMDLIEDCPDEVRPHLERLLAGHRLVEDLAAVPPGAAGVYVTPEGEVLRDGASVLTRTGAAWARAARHRAAAAAAAAAAGDQDAADAARRTARAEAGRIGRRAAAARGAAERAERARAAAAARIAAVERSRAEAAERHDAARAALAEAEAEVPAARVAADEAAEAARAAAGAAAAAQAGLQQAQAAVRAAEGELSAAQAVLAAARVAAAELAERDRALAARAVPVPPPDLSAVAAAAEALGDVAAVLALRAGDARGLLDTRRAAVRVARDALVTARAEAARTEEAAAAATAAMHTAEVALAGARARAEQLGPPTGEDPGEVDLEAQARAVEELERRRRAIGAVNPLAAEERDEIGGRIEEISEQVADLEEAAASLATHLEGLDRAVAEGFEDVFAAVRARFEEAVAALFPGGTGRLAEVEGADGEPGVEVQVVPAGKRPRSLSLMSGGERSLVALAFCLAIATARPAPFYLLDEVEAALDDTNLRRLLALVRSLSERTQFVMITHQQPTVEMADTLFGVTMATDGVSQVVARRLDRAIGQGARTEVRRRLTAIRGGRA